jgi:hypothetical protein
MGTSASSLGGSGGASRPLTIVSPVSDWTLERTDDELRNDELDAFNHPRLRRLLILQSLLSERRHGWKVDHVVVSEEDDEDGKAEEDGLEVYRAVHSEGLLKFLDTAWDAWNAMGEEGRDPSGWSPEFKGDPSESVPPLVPAAVPLPRAPHRQRPSSHVLGQVGYYCTDTVTPVFAGLRSELRRDAAIVRRVLDLLLVPPSPSAEASDDVAGSNKDEASAPEAPLQHSPEDAAADDDEEPGAAPEAAEAEGAAEDAAAPPDESGPAVLPTTSAPPPPPSPRPSLIASSRDPDAPPPVVYALTTHPGTLLPTAVGSSCPRPLSYRSSAHRSTCARTAAPSRLFVFF